MLGDFMYSNPTRLYFGEHAMDNLKRSWPTMARKYSWYMAAVPLKRMGFMIR